MQRPIAKCRKATLSTVEKCFFLVSLVPCGKLGQLPWYIVLFLLLFWAAKKVAMFMFSQNLKYQSNAGQVKCSMTRHASRSHRHSILLEIECVNPISIYIHKHTAKHSNAFIFILYIFLCLFSGMYLWTFTLMGGCVCVYVRG